MNLIPQLGPIASLIAGILILIMPLGLFGR